MDVFGIVNKTGSRFSRTSSLRNQPNHEKGLLFTSPKGEIVAFFDRLQVSECDESVAEKFANEIKNTMENIVKISVPLRADYVIAPFWGK